MCRGDSAAIQKAFADAAQAKKDTSAEAAKKAKDSTGQPATPPDIASAGQANNASARTSGNVAPGNTPNNTQAEAAPGCTWDGSSLFRIIVGWLVTAFAIMLGAPFWFDVLNKFMVIRSTIKPHEKSKEEASKDSQTSASSTADATGAAGGSGTPAAGAAAPVPFEERIWKPDVASDSREGIV
jgi:hypothetical protein